MDPTGVVLVVDDEPHNRDLLEQELEILGLSAVMAENGRAALDVLARERVDLVLLDMMMPELDGFATLKLLKDDPGRRHIPVVMISAVDDIRSIAACLERGADDYLPKPFDPVILAARVRGCLERKRWRDQEAVYVAHIERERRRADDLLRVVLPDDAVAELKETGRIAPARHERVAVLFADIVDFTRYSEIHDAQEVVANLDALMQACEKLIAGHGLEKIKSVGDGVAATANLLLPHPDPVMAALDCGRAMIAASRACPAAWEMRVGITFGPVVGGIVGRTKFAFDIWGDAVNTASRLSGLGRESAVFLSPQAHRQVEGRCAAQALDDIELKGKGSFRVMRVAP